MGSKKLTFHDICNSAAAVRCKQSGQSHAQTAKSAGKPPSTIRRWISKAGFKQRGGKLRHASEAIVDKLLEAEHSVVHVVEDGTADAFQAIYINGRLIVENPRRDVHDVLEALGITPSVVKIPYGFDGKFPDLLAKLKTYG